MSVAATQILRNIDEAGMQRVGARLATTIGQGGLIFLRGDLGAGKTTLARALISALGVGERIKSPTYSLIESYQNAALQIHHLDLYRIADPGELEWLGLGEILHPDALVLIEWPERGGSALPQADLGIELRYAGEGRELHFQPETERGRNWLVRALG